MNRDSIVTALQRLGELGCSGRVVVVGGAAGILEGWLERTTVDVDVVHADPKLSELRTEIKAVGKEMLLHEDWLNDGAKAWLEVLPPDWQERALVVGRFGELEVLSVSREDLILLKLIGFRAEDLKDLEELEPTPDEIEFVRNELPRISRFDPGSAHRVDLYLDQGLGQ